MKSLSSRALAVVLCAALIGLSSSPASAERGRGEGAEKKKTEQKTKRVRISDSFALASGAPADIADAEGRVQYDGKPMPGRKKKEIIQRHLKAIARLPVSATLGITDAATAAALPLHLEVLRAGEVVSDCSLAFQADRLEAGETEPVARFQYRLHAQVSGNGRAKVVKGACASGVPVLAAADGFKLYALVADVRVDLMTAGDDAALVAPTPTPEPTATPVP